MHVTTVEGLWTVEFGSSVGIFGGGVAVFQNGKVMGGDGGYFYLGSYQETGNTVRATVNVAPFISGYESVFKTVGRPFSLDLVATLTDENHAIGQGQVLAMPQLKLGLKLTRRS
jgi:hypothetical protein